MPKSTGSPEYQRLRGLLSQLRDEAGLTQVQLAKRLGVPQSYVSKYENGTRRLDMIEVRQVIDAIGVKPGVFLERLDPSWLLTE